MRIVYFVVRKEDITRDEDSRFVIDPLEGKKDNLASTRNIIPIQTRETEK